MQTNAKTVPPSDRPDQDARAPAAPTPAATAAAPPVPTAPAAAPTMTAYPVEPPLTDTTHNTASALATLASEHAQNKQTKHTTASDLHTLASVHTTQLTSEHAQKEDNKASESEFVFEDYVFDFDMGDETSLKRLATVMKTTLTWLLTRCPPAVAGVMWQVMMIMMFMIY